MNNKFLTSSSKLHNTLSIALALLFVFYFAQNILGIYLTGAYGWDDGAITLAYSRTLAENAKFSLTKVSEIVEGTSSLSLTFIMALMHKVFQFNFHEFISASQIFAFIFSSILGILIYQKSGVLLKNKQQQAVIALLVISLPMYTAEILNGMEMTFFSALLAMLVIAQEKNSKWLFILIPLTLLTRFESIFYLLFTFGSLILITKENKSKIYDWAIYTAFVFLIIAMCRWIYFSDFLPNTIWAKMQPPYTPIGSLAKLNRKIFGFTEFLKVEFWLLIPAFLLLPLREKSSKYDFKVMLVISFAIFSFLAGKNSGYQGRMFEASIPILVFVILDAFRNKEILQESVYLKYKDISLVCKVSKLVFAILCALLVLMHFANSKLFSINLETAMTGGYYQERLPKHFHNVVRKKLEKEPNEFGSWYGVTPENYKITGKAIDRLRSALDLNKIKFMTPDVGGIGLCCENIMVIDSGSLTNKYFAKNGYQYLNEVIRNMDPDIIETHGIWSKLSGIYKSANFQDEYIPIIFENNLLWINKKYYTVVLKSNKFIKSKIEGKIPHSVRYSGLPIDEEYLYSKNLNEIWNISLK